MTGLVGSFGAAALAGYGIGMRLEFMVAPLAFGIGTGLTTLVGVAAGAQDWKRAVRVAWIGGVIAFAAIGVIGWTVALLPESWSRLFTSEPEVIAASVGYLTRVAPFYCLFGLGLALNFASQGAGRMSAPFLAGVARLVVAAAGGWFAVEQMGWGLDGLFIAIAAGWRPAPLDRRSAGGAVAIAAGVSTRPATPCPPPSPIMIDGALVLPEVRVGMIEASATRSLSMPYAQPRRRRPGLSPSCRCRLR